VFNRLRSFFRLNSLAARLIAAAALWIVLGLVGGGIALSGIFRSSAESEFDTALQNDMEALIAAAGHNDSGELVLEPRFLSARYQRAYSGLYWQITPVKEGIIQISHSLLDGTIKYSDSEKKGNLVWGHAPGPEDQHLRMLSRQVEFPIADTARPDDTRAYTFFVAGDLAETDQRIADFNKTLIWSFLILGAGLIAALFIQVRIGLLPLRKVSEALHRIRDGRARRLEGEFPSEIEPLASELNSLIAHSAEVVGRARSYVSNLAHALKTPLTVLSSEAESHPGPLGEVVTKQVGAMRRQVDHYLTRARAAGALDVLGNRTPVAPVLEDLARVLRRIHEERGIAIEVRCPAKLAFRGERQDLEEMAGNLMDNACKWAKARVVVTATPMGASFRVAVEDDGQGLTAEERQMVGERGERLDESVPGTGLGLAIVRDIAKLYGGQFELEAAELGGLSAQLVLPALN
jgi:signal transduction histidine kinase